MSYNKYNLIVNTIYRKRQIKTLVLKGLLTNGADTVNRTQIKALPWPRNTFILCQQLLESSHKTRLKSIISNNSNF